MKLGLDETAIQHLEQQLGRVGNIRPNQLVIPAYRTLVLVIRNHSTIVTHQYLKRITEVKQLLLQKLD